MPLVNIPRKVNELRKWAKSVEDNADVNGRPAKGFSGLAGRRKRRSRGKRRKAKKEG